MGPTQKVIGSPWRDGEMASDDPCERVDEIGVGVDAGKLVGLDQGDNHAHSLPPPSELAKRALLPLRASGRTDRSTVLGPPVVG